MRVIFFFLVMIYCFLNSVTCQKDRMWPETQECKKAKLTCPSNISGNQLKF